MQYYIKAFQNYANFNGRATRSEYWWFFLINFIISMVFTVVGMQLKFAFLGNIYSLVTLLPALAVGVRRMHDIDKSGWYLLIPLYNIVLLATDTQRADNQYGPNTKADEAASV
ncbi:MAG: DUF805 domain-containing protein [Chitinophagales bacterium]|jgi:uncharacterized membrane protein YhaH (DUF805 family)|nr:DUF805 domain-containing protein [Chitinophagales bacterium]